MIEQIEKAVKTGQKFGKKFVEKLTKPISNVSSQQNVYGGEASKHLSTYDKRYPSPTPLSTPKPIIMDSPFSPITEFMKEKTYLGVQQVKGALNLYSAPSKSARNVGNLKDIFKEFQEKIDLGAHILLHKIGHLSGLTREEVAKPKQHTITKFHNSIFPPELIYNPSGTFLGFEESTLIRGINDTIKAVEVDNRPVDPRANFANVRER